MKKQILAVLSVISLILAGSAQAQLAPPSMGKSTVSAVVNTNLSRVSLQGVSGVDDFGPVAVDTFIGAAVGSVAHAEMVKKVINDTLAGKYVVEPRTITDPAMYTTIPNGKVAWHNFMSSETVSVWNGVEQTSGVFVGQRNGVVQQRTQAWSASGHDTISLSQLYLRVDSNDIWDLFGDVIYLERGYDYGSQAVGIHEDGRRVDSGPATQLVSYVIFVGEMKHFNGGDTEEGRQSVKSWIEGQNNFGATYEAGFSGTYITAKTAVSINGLGPIVPPHLAILKVADGLSLSVSNANPLRNYVIEVGSLDGHWTSFATVNGAKAMTVSIESGKTRIFRARVL